MWVPCLFVQVLFDIKLQYLHHVLQLEATLILLIGKLGLENRNVIGFFAQVTLLAKNITH